MADQFIQKPGGQITSIREAGFGSLQEAANVGFAPVAAPSTEIEPPTPELAPAPELPVASEAPVAPDEVPVLNRAQIETNIKETLQAPGVLDKPANKEFINAVSRLKLGRDATADELAQVGTGQFALGGSTVRDVLGRFGATDLAPAFGMAGVTPEAPVTPGAPEVPEVVEEPKTGAELLLDRIRATRPERAAVRLEAAKEAGVLTGEERVREASLQVQEAQNAIQTLLNLQEDEIEAIGDQPIPRVFIERQQAALTKEQRKELRDAKQDFNNALIIQQIEQGSLANAEQFAKQLANDKLSDAEDEINDLLLEEEITQAEASLLRQEAEIEFARQAEGFVLIDEATAAELPVDQKITIGDKIYLRPQADLAETELQQLDLVSKQLGIEKQLLENALIGDDSFQTTVTTKDGLFRLTYDKFGNEINRSKIGDLPAGTKGPTAMQAKASGFATRIDQAEAIFKKLAGVGTGLGEAFGARHLPEMFKNENRKSFEQAERNFINAQLRRESGAAIAPSEFESARLQYIPQPGDGEKVLQQKADNRKIILEGLKLEAGDAFVSAASLLGDAVENTADLYN